MDEVQHLARAMCEALGRDPDEKVTQACDPHDRGAKPSRSMDMQIFGPLWRHFEWDARQWLFVNSGGRLPRKDDGNETP